MEGQASKKLPYLLIKFSLFGAVFFFLHYLSLLTFFLFLLLPGSPIFLCEQQEEHEIWNMSDLNSNLHLATYIYMIQGKLHLMLLSLVFKPSCKTGHECRKVKSVNARRIPSKCNTVKHLAKLLLVSRGRNCRSFLASPSTAHYSTPFHSPLKWLMANLCVDLTMAISLFSQTLVYILL